MELKWIGDPRYVVGVEGWPAADHDEPDPKVARDKLKSKLYAKAGSGDGSKLPPVEGPAKQEESNRWSPVL